MASVGPLEVVVHGSPDEGFAGFTAELGAWWPPPYRGGPGSVVDHRLEPRVGGRVTEVADDGFELDWARVEAWEPPARLVLSWAIGPDRVPTPEPARRSTVEVTFTAHGDGGTRVRLHHRDLEAHGDDDGSAYAAGLGSTRGWPWILELFTQHQAS